MSITAELNKDPIILTTAELLSKIEHESEEFKQSIQKELDSGEVFLYGVHNGREILSTVSVHRQELSEQ